MAMNIRDRFLTTLRGGTADRVPIMLDGFCTPDREALAAWDDPARRDIGERLFSHMAFAHNIPSHTNRYLVTPSQRMKVVDEHKENGAILTTTEIDTPRGKLTAVTGVEPGVDTSWTAKYPCETVEDMEKIRSVLWELPEGLTTPARKDLPASLATRGYVRTSISSPMVCVAGMMSYENYLMFCITEPALIHELTIQAFEREMAILDVLLADGSPIEYVWMGGCEWLTPPMGSPALYAGLVQPFEQKLIERIHKAGALCHVHCHGNVRSTLEMVIARGGDFFEPVEPPPDGDITFAEAKQLAAGRMTLGGNVEDRLIANESADVVEAATRAAFEGGKERMILKTSANPIAAMTDRMRVNYHRLIDVWEELSPIL